MSIRLMKECICAQVKVCNVKLLHVVASVKGFYLQGSHTMLATPWWTCCNSSAMRLLMLVTLNLKYDWYKNSLTNKKKTVKNEGNN